jgi:hypothetical protein
MIRIHLATPGNEMAKPPLLGITELAQSSDCWTSLARLAEAAEKVPVMRGGAKHLLFLVEDKQKRILRYDIVGAEVLQEFTQTGR